MADPRHRCGNCEGISPETCLYAPHEELRHRFIEAIGACERPTMEDLADAVMAVRDDELERLRLIAGVNHGLHRSAHDDAEQADAAIARVRALHEPFRRSDDVPYCDECSVLNDLGWRRLVLVPWPCATLAALDDTKPETRNDGEHG